MGENEENVDLEVIEVDDPKKLPKRYRPLRKLPQKGRVYVYHGTQFRYGSQFTIIAKEIEDERNGK